MWLAVLAVAAIGGRSAGQGLAWTKIARSGEYAPGMPGCLVYPQGQVAPQIDNEGSVLFRGVFVCDDGEAGDGLLYGGTQSLSALQLIGQPPPGLNPNSIITGWKPLLAESGAILTITELGINAVNSLYAGDGAGLGLVAGIGEPAPGVPSGTTVAISDSQFRINGSGNVAFRQVVQNSPNPNYAVLVEGPLGALSTVVQSNGPVPGVPGATLSFGTAGLTYNDLGWLGFSSFLEGPGIDGSNNVALFSGDENDLHILARTGSQAPDMPAGVTFLNFSSVPGQNGEGDVSFFGLVQGPGITRVNNLAYWAGPRDAPEVILQTGDEAPGLTGHIFETFNWATFISEDSRALLAGKVSGADISANNDDVVWWGPFDALTPLIHESDPAPGLPRGVQIAVPDEGPALPAFARNDVGDILMFGQIMGPGVSSGNDYALWHRAFDTGSWHLVLRTGQLFDGKTIAGDIDAIVPLLSAGTEGFGQAINDDGVFTVNITFGDGTRGLYTFAVPEPGALVLIAIACGCAMMRSTRIEVSRGCSKEDRYGSAPCTVLAYVRPCDSDPTHQPSAS